MSPRVVVIRVVVGGVRCWVLVGVGVVVVAVAVAVAVVVVVVVVVVFVVVVLLLLLFVRADHEHMPSWSSWSSWSCCEHGAHAEHEHMHSHANMLVLAPTRALPAAPAHPQTSGDLRRDGGPHQPRLQPTAQTGTYEAWTHLDVK